jgi:polysaccharide export outer membrane protein
LKNNNPVLKIVLAVLVFAISSCVSRTKLALFQSEASATIPAYKINFSSGDLLEIQVVAQDAELAAPFNPYAALSSGQATGYSNGIASANGFLIDSKGHIQFPILGEVSVGGLSKEEAENTLEEKLKVYLQNPIVKIRLLNFRISILGDVRNPGSFIIPNEKITLPEAIALSGDLNITARRDNLLLIRTVAGKTQNIRIDLTKQDLFGDANSYYLQQGDIVYVEPNRAQRNSSAINSRLGIVISVASLFLTSLTLILK